jgi:hypothetical protein
MSAVIIKHVANTRGESEQYIIGIASDLLTGLNNYLDGYYPGVIRHYLNKLPVSCKEFVPVVDNINDTVTDHAQITRVPGIPTILLIVTDDTALNVYRVVKKSIAGWSGWGASDKFRSELIFSIHTVKIATGLLSQYAELEIEHAELQRTHIKEKTLLENKITRLQSTVLKLHDSIDANEVRDEVVSKRMEILISMLPPDKIIEFTRLIY